MFPILAICGILLAQGCAPKTVPAPRMDPSRPGSVSVQTGIASWYGGKFHGRRTANGEVFDQHGLSAAHKTLPFGTRVRVVNLDNGRSLILRINDRGPFVKGRIIDVSRRAAHELGFLNAGLAQVRLEILGSGS